MIRAIFHSALMALLLVGFASTTNATVVFEADFESGSTAADVGTLSFNFDTTLPGTTVGLVPTSTAGTAFGSNSLLIDDFTSDNIFVQYTLGLTQAVSLTNGNTATFSFDTLVRRSGNIAFRTQFVTGFDSSGNEVFQFVLNDGTGERQQPRFGTLAGGIQTFDSNPGQFFYGADSSPASVNTNQFAQFELTIGENSFDFQGINQNGTTFTDTDVALFDGPATDLASIVVSADRVPNGTTLTSGNYYDNFLVDGVIAVPEPSSLAVLLVGAGCVGLRRKRK